MKNVLFFIWLLTTSLVVAQNTTSIRGTITDKEMGNEPLPFANVQIKGMSKGATTDMEGNYSIEGVAPGTYTVIFSFIGYKTVEVSNVVVVAGKDAQVNIALGADNVALDEVVITTTVKKESQEALLVEQRKALEIKQSIGAQELSQKGVSDVATAVTKTTGISKQEGTGTIYVRGLGDRYNSSSMNGLPLPSNDPQRKNIDLDIFTTDIVEYISIDKVYNSKMYGDFAGGNVDIVSKDYNGNGFLALGVKSSVNSNAIGEDNFYLQSGYNASGFNKVEIPSNALSGFNFKNKLNADTTIPLAGSLALTGGKSFSVGENSRLSFFATASFGNEYGYQSGVNRSAQAQGEFIKNFRKESYDYSTNTTGMFNVGYRINEKNKLSYNLLYVNSSNQQKDEYKGYIRDIAEDDNGIIQRSTYVQNTLFVNQLLGEHTYNERIKLDWGASYNTIVSNMPDRIQNTMRYDFNQSGYVLATNATTDNHRYYQDLDESEIAANVTLGYRIGKTSDEEYKGRLVLGYNARIKNREFEATQFNFRVALDQRNTLVSPDNLDAFFNQNNYNAGAFAIETFRGGANVAGALDPQVYSGDQEIFGGYLNLEYQLTNKLSGVLGMRGEQIYQKVSWRTQLDDVGSKNDFDKTAILPNLTLKYELNEKQNLRLAASKTYTLPQFKERARFVYEDVTEVIVGNPYLYPSDDYNLDLKWELFPNRGEIVSFTGFGKYIQNPINEITLASSTNDIAYVNTGDMGYAVGAEVEVRKNLWNLEEDGKESRITAGLNAAYMHTQQDLDANKVRIETKGSYNVNFSNTEDGFTGASDLLLNADVTFYKRWSENRDVMMVLAYNHFSDRIRALGTETKGNIVDKGVGALDFILKSKLSSRTSIGISAKNILNPAVERTQQNPGNEILVGSFKKGINFGIGFNYQF
ncbi:TonB-dependent receptor [Imtechella halotolerans]|uniref:TonB-dependent receptor n=1 Tax=Imtechella halotolerans K1 TaxID=946077 RepID=I0WJ04_9FLAO|nr:TonB-dependent receptor [Imtechella halotolerans]EID76370.1 TonB-dependent receptor [Imtechella halotolerans K1]WMQ63056.1 carboxypeptidase-like regulatory domain-containing protein [Imtechella halotolerans]